MFHLKLVENIHLLTDSWYICECLSRPFILGEDFMSKHYMKLGWTPGKKRTLGYLSDTIAVASQEVTNKPLVLQKLHQNSCQELCSGTSLL